MICCNYKCHAYWELGISEMCPNWIGCVDYKSEDDLVEEEFKAEEYGDGC